jgi:protein-tyrosine phosphatase
MTTRLLYVCTANQCRSPIAEALTGRLVRTGLSAASAGFLEGGYRAPEAAQHAAAGLGLDLSAHRSRTLAKTDVDQADAVLCMTREHARRIVAAWPEAWPRVATVKQFSRWLVDEDVARGLALGEWMDGRSRNRSRDEIVGRSDADDIVDPMGRSARVWRRSVDDIRRSVEVIAERLGQ